MVTADAFESECTAAPTLHELELAYMEPFIISPICVQAHKASHCQAQIPHQSSETQELVQERLRAASEALAHAQQSMITVTSNYSEAQQALQAAQEVMLQQQPIQAESDVNSSSGEHEQLQSEPTCKAPAVPKAGSTNKSEESEESDSGADFDLSAAAENDLECLLDEDF